MESKKELIKKFNLVVEDLLDNYEKYTAEEKAKIKELFEQLANLNTILDKYDIEHKFDWAEYVADMGRFFRNING